MLVSKKSDGYHLKDEQNKDTNKNSESSVYAPLSISIGNVFAHMSS